MAFIADLSRLLEKGKLTIDTPISQTGPSLDIPIGDTYWIDFYRLERNENKWLQEVENRKLIGEAYYIAFTKDRINVSSGYRLFIDPRSSFARLGLNTTRFENDYLYKFIKIKKLPSYEGRIPLVIRTMRTNLFLPENYPSIQLLVAEEGTIPLNTEQLIEACKNGHIEVLRAGKQIEPEKDEFPLTFHPKIKRYSPSSHIFSPYENTETYFNTFNMLNFLSEGFDIAEDCFHLGSTSETVRIGNRHLGMLTHSYPYKWRRTLYRYEDEAETIYSVDPPSRSRYRKERIEEWVEPAGYVHLTPWIKPGSNGNQTLEIAAKFFSHDSVTIHAGDKACSLKIFELDDECTPYNGRYKGQDGPSVSRLYKNSI